jgi:hypothetical protein
MPQPSPPSSYPATRRRPRGSGKPRDDFIDLVDSPMADRAAATVSAAAAASASADVVNLMHESDDEDNDGWSCPRCTLVNPLSRTACDACLLRRPGPVGGFGSRTAVRSPDPTRTDRLIPPQQPQLPRWYYGASDEEEDGGVATAGSSYLLPPGAPALPRSFVSSGAILGGVLGAAGAYAQGRPVARGALDGAFGGAVGGIAVDAVVQQQQQLLQQQQASAAAMQQLRLREQHQRGSHRADRRQPRGGNVRTFRLPNGAIVITTGGRAGSTSFQSGPDPGMMEALLHESMMAAMMGRGGGGAGGGMGAGGSGAGMNYDQLLQMFGDGTENLGARDGQIDALPTTTVQSAGQKKEQCAICLQDFEVGDSFRTLPCLHSDFHTACIDQWLKTNAACPVCKHRLD